MIILGITILGLVLRLVLANQSLWLDEAASWVIASQPLKELISSLAGDFHPPLYYLLLHFYLPLAGKNELLLRLPGIVIGALTIPALYCLVKQTKLKTAAAAALLLALNPLHVYYSQELRMYSLSTLLAVLTWYFLIKKKFLPFTFLTIISFYTFYLSVFILISQWLYMIVTYRQEKPKTCLSAEMHSFWLGNLIFIISCLPWLSRLFNQLKGGGYLTQVLPNWSVLSGSLSLKSLVLIPVKFSLGRISISPQNLYYLIAGLILSFIFLLFSLTPRLKQAKLFLFWLFAPLVLAVMTGFFSPILGYWRYIFLLPAFSALLAIGVSRLPKKISIINLGLLILLFLSSNLFFFTNPRFHREDWSSFARLINKKPNALLLVNFTDAFAPLKFYLPKTKVFPTQSKLGEARSDLDEALPPLISFNTPVYYLDYLSDLTSPKRPILAWLKMAGLTPKTVYQFNGLGVVYEYQAP